MRILILNWRDIKNPSSGGAEILTHEIAKRLVGFGNQVTQFSSFYAGARPKEVIDNISIIREGNEDIRSIFFSVHFRAFLFYKKNKEKFDVVLDEIHGVPFFTPWYISGKKLALICEVADVLWIKSFGYFYGTLGQFVEKLYLTFIYKNILYLTISESTKSDLLKNGVAEKNITVLPMGVNIPKKNNRVEKEKQLTLIFIGRLTKAKGIEGALSALKEVMNQEKKVKLWIIGRGEDQYMEYLTKLCTKIGVQKNVTFFGYVSEEEKFSLLARAHILIHLSILEGFGLTIPEAGSVGTPVVAYNSQGLKDIVKNGRNGILLDDNSPKALARAVIDLISNTLMYRQLSSGAKEEAKQYNWDVTARVAFACLQKI